MDNRQRSIIGWLLMVTLMFSLLAAVVKNVDDSNKGYKRTIWMGKE